MCHAPEGVPAYGKKNTVGESLPAISLTYAVIRPGMFLDHAIKDADRRQLRDLRRLHRVTDDSCTSCRNSSSATSPMDEQTESQGL